MKRILSALLALLMCSSMLVACSDGNSGDSETTAAPTTTAAPETTPPGPQYDEYGREIINHSLPDDLDFGGTEVVNVMRDNVSYSIDFGVDALTGEIVNDTIFERNSRVEEELGLTITNVKVADTNTLNTESVGDKIRQSIMADTSEYDVCGVYQIYGATLATEGMLMNVYDMEHMDFEKPWWNQYFVDGLTYNDQLYFLVGSMNLSVTSSLMGYYFSMEKITDHYQGYQFLYDLVYDGKWTYDKLNELVTGVYTDLNTNNKQDEADFFGLLVKEDDPGPINAALGIDLVIRDESGVPQITFYSERTTNAYAKLYNLYRKTDGVYFGAKTFDWRTAFAEGRGLFACCSLESAQTHFRDMEGGYGLLPMPKYDEEQEIYYNAARDTSNLTGIVANSQKPEAAAAMLELMNYYSYCDVVPVYYEVAMKTKYFSDSDSGKMFDLIVNNVKVDFGELYSLAISGGTYSMLGIYAGKMRNMLRSDIENIASNWAQYEPLYKKCLTQILDKFDSIG